jgi:hypothetical protein
VIAESRNINNDAVRHSVEALLELKKAQELAKQGSHPQTICEHLASYLNHLPWCGFCFKDLNRSWTFYWYANRKQRRLRVALYKLKLENEGEPARGKIYSESLNDESRRETLPTTLSTDFVSGCRG